MSEGVMRLAVPSDQNMAIITSHYASPQASLGELQPDLEAQRRAEQQRTVRESRRQQMRLGQG